MSFVCLCVCINVCLSFCLFACLFVCLFVCSCEGLILVPHLSVAGVIDVVEVVFVCLCVCLFVRVSA